MARNTLRLETTVYQLVEEYVALFPEGARHFYLFRIVVALSSSAPRLCIKYRR